MYSTCTTCDDLLRQYHFFTVLRFCRESEIFCWGECCVRSASSQLFYPDPLSKLLHYHSNSNPSANFRSYTSSKYADSSFYMYKHSRFLYSMEVLPIYQKINLFFLQCYTILCVKNSQSPESAMPTKIIRPARISRRAVEGGWPERLLRIRHGRVINPPAQEIWSPEGHSQASPFPSVLPSRYSSLAGSMLSGYRVCSKYLHLVSGERAGLPQLVLKHPR